MDELSKDYMDRFYQKNISNAIGALDNIQKDLINNIDKIKSCPKTCSIVFNSIVELNEIVEGMKTGD